MHTAKHIGAAAGLHSEEPVGLDGACRALNAPALWMMVNTGVKSLCAVGGNPRNGQSLGLRCPDQ